MEKINSKHALDIAIIFAKNGGSAAQLVKRLWLEKLGSILNLVVGCNIGKNNLCYFPSGNQEVYSSWLVLHVEIYAFGLHFPLKC